MTLDYLFQDCEVIADKYEQHLIDVVIEYARIELDYKKQLTSLKHEVILELTDIYFKNKYTFKHANVKEVK